MKPSSFVLLTGLALLAAAPVVATAQYKVVQPDGSIGYTDRPPVTSNARISNLRRPGAGGAVSEIGLPAELRGPVQKHPVVLYTSPDCQPCDSGRKLLQQRGVPFAEKRVGSDEDAAALERLVGGRTVPALTIGAQPLRGWSEADWSSYLDAAGYPRENRLPKGWQAPEPGPVVERATPAVLPGGQELRSSATPPVMPQPAQGGIRF
ncbi:MAG: glutaredoxin family protein [Rubrivivax sp.]|nr:glutaredoxin family protein [Rubrivivax sp.]